MAIAVDATSSATTTSATSLTWSHTCSGTQRVLVVIINSYFQNSLPTGVTYNGVSMTLRASEKLDIVSNDGYASLWTLADPATGANNIVASFSTTFDDIGGAAVSFTGFGNLGATSASANDSTVTTHSNTLTATGASGYIVTGLTGQPQTDWNAYAGSGTEFARNTITNIISLASYKTFTGTGAKTETWTSSTARRDAMVAIELNPAADSFTPIQGFIL